MECCATLSGIILPNHIRHSCRQICLNLLFRQVKTMLVISHNLLPIHRCLQRIQTLLCTKAVICLPFFNQFLCIFQINSGRLTLTLNIRTNSSVFVWSLIVYQTSLFQCPVNNLCGSLHITLLVCVLNSQEKIPVIMFCNQISIQCRS